MSALTEKELSTIKDLLSAEELLVKKFKMLAEHADKPELKIRWKALQKNIRVILTSYIRNYLN